MSLLTLQQAFPTDDICLAFLEQQRWGKDGKNRYCPHCASVTTYKYKDGKLYKCADCHKQFTVTIGTVFEGSHLPLQKWFYAIYLNTSLKKGISSIQLAKYLEITQKSAWFMLQRIRHGLRAADNTFLNGVVEVDETYVGGRRRGGRTGTADKAAIFGAVERKGRVQLQHVKSSGSRTLIPEVTRRIAPGSTVYSDQWQAYRTLYRYGYEHDTVNHGVEEFVRGIVHTNTIEGGVWSHLKKSLNAIYISVSRKHLQSYCAEFEYRYNTREMKDDERFNWWFKNCNGRLRYKELIA